MKKNIDLNVNEEELTFQRPSRKKMAKDQRTLDFFNAEKENNDQNDLAIDNDIEIPADTTDYTPKKEQVEENQNNVELNNTSNKKGEEIAMKEENELNVVDEKFEEPTDKVNMVADASEQDEKIEIHNLEIVNDILENQEVIENIKDYVEKVEKEYEDSQKQQEIEEEVTPWESATAKIQKILKDASVNTSICKVVVKSEVLKEVENKTILNKLSNKLDVAKTKTIETVKTNDVHLNNSVSNIRRKIFENKVKNMLSEKNIENVEITRKNIPYTEQFEQAFNILLDGITKNDFAILNQNKDGRLFDEKLYIKEEKQIKKTFEKAIDKLSDTRLEIALQKRYIDEKLWKELEKVQREKTQLYRDGIGIINNYQKQVQDVISEKSVEFIDNTEVIKEKVREAIKESYAELLDELTNCQAQIDAKDEEIKELSQKFIHDTTMLEQNQTMLVYMASKLKREIEKYRQYFVEEELIDNLISQIDKMNIKSGKVEYTALLEDLIEKEQNMRMGILKEYKKLSKTSLLDDNLKNHTILSGFKQIEAPKDNSKNQTQDDELVK